MPKSFSPITTLQLRKAFSDIDKFQEITAEDDYLKVLFEWTDRGSIFIHDDAMAGHSIFLTNSSGIGLDKFFTLLNPNHRDMFLWHIDGVMYKKGSKCDCAFMVDDYVGFVEFKANAAQDSQQAIVSNYDKAKSQLVLTIKDVLRRCEAIGVDMLSIVRVKAFAVFNRAVPRNNAYQKKVSAEFLLETNGLPLFFANSEKL